MPLIGKSANLPTACLPLLAALTPNNHQVTLMDENVADLDFDRIAKADIVGLTGMSVQRFRMKEILDELKRLGKFVVIGGPWVTVREDYFGDLTDVIFIGEAEDTWPQFLNDWQTGNYQKRYEQSQKTDMTKVPCPRYDLIAANRYVFGSIQISRGCPFQCEFCDIIVTFGRRPRLKTSPQVIAELEAMKKVGMEIAFIVDDNLIGNKQAIKPILKDVIQWQQDNGYPFTFFAEASIDLADDEELLDLMVSANIQAVFVGIETPNEESLRETKKFQNLRSGGTIIEKVHRIQKAGMEVWTGMIIGFDNDNATIFNAQLQFVKEAKIVHAMCGMLSAIPKTPLYQRLADENRLDFSDQPDFGTNVIPKLLTREELSTGYRQVMGVLNDHLSYFDRADSLYHDKDFQFNKAQQAYWKKHPVNWAVWQSKTLVKCLYLYYQLMRQVKDPQLKAEYRKRLGWIWKKRKQPAALFVYLLKCAIHFHYQKITASLNDVERPMINTF